MRCATIVTTIGALALVLAGCGTESMSPSSIDERGSPAAAATPSGAIPAIDSDTPTSSPSLLSDLASASPLPDLDMPGARAGGAGEYGWEGGFGAWTGMHKVVESGAGQTQMVFAIQNDCFASGEGPEPVQVIVAGLDARYVEPYDGPRVIFMPRRESGQTTGGYALPIGDRTLCVYLTWDATSTTDELDAARQIVESIRGEAYGPDGIRINFTLPAGWDTG